MHHINISDTFIQMLRAECLSLCHVETACVWEQDRHSVCDTYSSGGRVPMCKMVTWEINFVVGCDEIKYIHCVLHVRAL